MSLLLNTSMPLHTEESGPSEEGLTRSSSLTERLLRQISRGPLQESEQNGQDKNDCEDEENEEEEEEEVEEEGDPIKKSEELVLGPLLPLKVQLEKDKEDESLRRWKEQLLGSVHIDSVGEDVEPEVRVLSLSILSKGRPDIIIPFPIESNSKSHLFTLKEGTAYNFKFAFLVRRNIVSGLTFLHTIWKNGFRVDSARVMLGTFSPQLDAYSHILEEETTPSGILARGSYTARLKFIDDDGKCYLDIQHSFDIKKDW